MVEVDEKWILPEEMIKKQILERDRVDKGDIKNIGSQGCYYAFRKGLIGENELSAHTVSNDIEAYYRIKNLQDFLSMVGLKIQGKVLDIACGIGALTNSINELDGVEETYGIDISEDAILVARERYPKCKFHCQSADNLDNFEDEYFDIIYL